MAQALEKQGLEVHTVYEDVAAYGHIARYGADVFIGDQKFRAVAEAMERNTDNVIATWLVGEGAVDLEFGSYKALIDCARSEGFLQHFYMNDDDAQDYMARKG